MVTWNAMIKRLGFSNEARNIIIDVAHEGIFTMANMAKLQDDDVDELISTLRKPGGTVPGVAGGAAVLNLWVYVNSCMDDKMKMACFMARHYAHTGSTLNNVDITARALMRWKTYHLVEKDYIDPELDSLKLLKPNQASAITFIEDFPELLAGFTTEYGSSLAYVI